MRRVFVIAVAGVSLAGCSSSSFSWDSLKPTPPAVQVQLDSTPQGADARTSIGQGCKTPCSVSLTPPDGGFSVTFTKEKFQPATVPVQVAHVDGDLLTAGKTNIEPNPVVAELQAEAPPPKPRKPHPRKPKPAAAAAPTAPAAADSAFPAPAPRPRRPRLRPPVSDGLRDALQGVDCRRLV